MMSVLTTKVARWLYALPFAVFGLFHFMNASAMAGMIPGWLPGGVFWIYLTGFALLAASFSFIIEKKVHLAGQLLALMLVLFVILLHLPGAIEGDQNSVSALLKDLALAGGALLMAGNYPEEPTSTE